MALTSLEIIATVRARAIVHGKVTTRLRFFSASEKLDDWSVLDVAPIYRSLRDALRAGVDNPSAWLDRDFDIFADVTKHTPEYGNFIRSRDGEKARLVGSQRSAPSFSAVLDEIYTPSDEDNAKTDDLTEEALSAWCAGMLHTFENGQGATYVDDGAYAEAQQTPEMKKALAGTKRNTNDSEGYFGSFKYYIQQFGRLAKYLGDAVVSAQRDEIFARIAGQFIVTRKQRVSDAGASASTLKQRAKRRVRQGRLARLSPELQLEVLEFSHHEGRDMFLADARSDDAAASAADVERREQLAFKASERQARGGWCNQRSRRP